MTKLPVKFSKEDYIRECTGTKSNLIATVVFSILIPAILVFFWQQIEGADVWISILFASAFPLVMWILYFFSYLRSKKENMPAKIEEFFANGRYEDGVFVSYTRINPTLDGAASVCYYHYFYSNIGARYPLFREVPSRIGTDKKPMKCRAIVYNNSAIICNLYSELENYSRPQDFDGHNMRLYNKEL